jgi:hypothetical protein
VRNHLRIEDEMTQKEGRGKTDERRLEVRNPHNVNQANQELRDCFMRCRSKRAVTIYGTPFSDLGGYSGLTANLVELAVSEFRIPQRQATFSGKAREINPWDNRFCFCLPATGCDEKNN